VGFGGVAAPAGQTAPDFTHSVMSAISCSLSLPPGGIFSR
jgi:hypothetical protein